MRKLLMFLGGLVTGLGVGIVTAQVVAPMSGKALADEAQARLEALKEEARRASEARQAELQAQLSALTGGAITLDAQAPAGAGVDVATSN